MENFFSALAIVWRKIFSAFGVIVLACIKEMPYGFGEGPYCELGEEQVEDVGEGAAAASFGCAGKPGHFVREKLGEDNVQSEIEALLECRLSGDLVGVLEVVLKRDLAGDVATEKPGEADRGGVVGEEFAGIWMSFRTTMREICNRFLASRVET
jgi:hypothetical protein